MCRNEGLSLVGKQFWICVDGLSCEESFELSYLAVTDKDDFNRVQQFVSDV